MHNIMKHAKDLIGAKVFLDKRDCVEHIALNINEYRAKFEHMDENPREGSNS